MFAQFTFDSCQLCASMIEPLLIVTFRRAYCLWVVICYLLFENLLLLVCFVWDESNFHKRITEALRL